MVPMRLPLFAIVSWLTAVAALAVLTGCGAGAPPAPPPLGGGKAAAHARDPASRRNLHAPVCGGRVGAPDQRRLLHRRRRAPGRTAQVPRSAAKAAGGGLPSPCGN